jgi:hypothetical protein
VTLCPLFVYSESIKRELKIKPYASVGVMAEYMAFFYKKKSRRGDMAFFAKRPRRQWKEVE